MKKQTIISLIIPLIILMSFTKIDNNYQTECIALETEGYVSIKIWNTKSGKSYKSLQARKDAIHAILYSGIEESSSCPTQKALLIKSEDIDKFKKIEKDFFGTNGKWVEFTRSSTTETTLPINLGGEKLESLSSKCF